MPYGVIYRLRFQAPDIPVIEAASDFITVNICDSETFTEDPITPDVTMLEGGDVPFRVTVIDNDRDKFKPIRAKRATITFLSTASINARTFSVGEDNRWYVEAFVESSGEFLFKGFLVMDDHQQPFLPPTTYTVQLIATDNLGTLKDVPLTEPPITNEKGMYRIVDWLAVILQKTGLQLEIISTDTWMEEDNQDFHPQMDLTYFHKRTFEGNKVGEYVNCYEALQIILSYHLFLTQRDGKWWIGSIDELTGNVSYMFRFDYEGTYIETLPEAEFSKTIGKNHIIRLAGEDALQTFIRPHKSVRLTYNYEYPKEIVDNIDFSRGEETPVPLSPGQTSYFLEDWTLGRYVINSPNSVSIATSAVYIVRTFENGYEKERYVVMTHTFLSSPNTHIRSNPIPLHEKDKITVSVDFRDTADANEPGVSVSQFMLVGDDGKVYIGTIGVWVDTSVYSSPGTMSLTGPQYQTQGEPTTEWHTHSVELPPLPVSGDLYIFLISGTGQSVVRNRHYQNLRFDYSPFVNGSYQKYNGHYNEVSQEGNYKAKIDEVVAIGDSERKLFKGSMFLQPSPGVFELTKRWYSAGDFLNQGGTYPVSDGFLNSFGRTQIFALWNQYNRPMVELTGSALGLSFDEGVPDLHSNYEVDTPSMENKNFVMCAQDMDPHKQEWNLTLLESYDSSIGKVYDDTFTFKYLEDY